MEGQNLGVAEVEMVNDCLQGACMAECMMTGTDSGDTKGSRFGLLPPSGKGLNAAAAVYRTTGRLS